MNSRARFSLLFAALIALAACSKEQPSGPVANAPAPQTTPQPTVQVTPQLTPQTAPQPIAQTTPTQQPGVQATPNVPPLADWKSGAGLPLKPTLLVSLFETESDDDRPWGPFMSLVLMDKLSYAPNELFSMPLHETLLAEYRYLRRIDETAARVTPFSEDDSREMARMFGMKYVLTGKVTKDAERLAFEGAVRKSETFEPLAALAFETPIAKLAPLLTSCSLAVVDAVEMELEPATREYLAGNNPSGGETFVEAMTLWADPPTSRVVRAKKWSDLYERDPSFLTTKVFTIDAAIRVPDEEALKIPLKRVEFEPDQGRIRIHLIGRLFVYEEYNQLIEEAGKFLKANPNNLTALRYLAKSYDMTYRYDEAAAVAERMVELNPDSWQTHNELARTLHHHAWYLRGTDYWRDVPAEGKRRFPSLVRRSMQEAQAALERNPHNPDCHVAIAVTLTETGGPNAEVERLCRKALEIDPGHHWAYDALLRHYHPGWSNQHDKAMALCREAAENNPDDAHLQWMMADYLLWYIGGDRSQTGLTMSELLQKPEITEAIETSFEKALALRPDQNDWRSRAGDYYFQRNDHEKAWHHYERVTELPPRYKKNPPAEHEFWTHMAWSAWRVEQFDKAYEFAKTALTKSPCNICYHQLYCVLGGVHEHREEWDEALKHYEHAAMVGGPHANWVNGKYAEMILNHKREWLDKGFPYIEKVVAANPSNAHNRVVYGKYFYYRNKDLQNARKQFEAALMIDPDLKWAQEWLAEVEKQTNEK